MLRMKFHSYSRSQQISSVRPSADPSLKSALKENEGTGWRQVLKSPIRLECRTGVPAKFALTQKSNNISESEFTRKARELLARSLTKRGTSSTTHGLTPLAPQTQPIKLSTALSPFSSQTSHSLLPSRLIPSTRSPPPEKRDLTSSFPTRLQIPHDHWQGWFWQGVGGHSPQPENLLCSQRNV